MSNTSTPAKPPLLIATEEAQATASHPGQSAWVSANAGAGKTHVLKMRVLRLLLAGTKPERILCLTYTKAAAAEMADRVFKDLSTWALAPDEKLATELSKLLDVTPTTDDIARARQLFARAIETPGGLKVQTIHAFCERLLQRFPLEAGVPPGFQILDDDMGQTIRREAIDDVLKVATMGGQKSPANPVLSQALDTMIVYAANDSFDEALRDALGQRKWLAAMSRLDLRSECEPYANAENLYRRIFDIPAGTTRDALDAELLAVIADAELIRIKGILASGSTNDQKAAERINNVLTAASPSLKVDDLIELFLTASSETPRATMMTKSLAAEYPDVLEQLNRSQDRIVTIFARRRNLVVVEATMAMLKIADAVQQRYTEAKARRAALDFDDLIEATANLLSRSSQAEWVLYKLDGGLDHILVDEAQDTSPTQWRVIEALAGEFFSGVGTAEAPRTLFAVGDEKQSIYSFQGAAPKMFAETGTRFAATTAQAGLPWRTVPLQLSFRSVAPVLSAVDKVFASPERTPGLSATGNAVSHLALRLGQAGLVEIWPTETWDDVEASDAFQPNSEATSVSSPVAKVAARIADTIKGWLNTGETLTSSNRPIRPRDIIILVRKRGLFAAQMVQALKTREIPVAGADRMLLTSEIAVQDLVALGDFLTLPEDDLALAAVLKSPLFDLTDDDLLTFAPGRKATLWTALLEAAKTNPRLVPAATALRRWRMASDFMPPYEFFASLLDQELLDPNPNSGQPHKVGARTRFLNRLGPEAADPLDEFLNLALTYDDSAPPSIPGFLHWLREGRREIKRDMEQTRDEIRVMTVHGAKGLEAPIVFLPDTCSSATMRKSGKLLALADDVPRPSGTPAPYVWVVKGTSKLERVAEAQGTADAAEQSEHQRLLYVAMTRPRDRLYVCGYEAKTGRARGCWYDLIIEGLKADLVDVPVSATFTVRRLEAAQTEPHESAKLAHAKARNALPLPPWATRRAGREANLTMPIAPSRLAPLDADEAGEPLLPVPAAKGVTTKDQGTDEPVAPSPRTMTKDNKFLRGTLTHALLEHLPTLPPTTWQSAAIRFIAQRGADLSTATRASIVSESLAVLTDPTFAAVFGPGSRAEVPLVAEIANPNPKRGAAKSTLKVTGQIDRLVITDHDCLIIDYKTNRPPPLLAEGVPQAYLLQLAAYRLALRQIFPTKQVRAAILWTDGARLMPISEATLTGCEHKLWTQEAAKLDAHLEA
jgi:ATP-dependent helicase/nuclease subunit A